jgi:hypothetical protein
MITSTAELTHKKAGSTPKRKKVERSKPTEAVGLDLWSPGIY